MSSAPGYNRPSMPLDRRPRSLTARLIDLNSVPYLARRNYFVEMRHLALWGIFAGMFEGTVSSIVAAKTFHAGPWLITVVMATPMLANLLGLVWGSIATGRRKLPLFMVLAVGTLSVVASVGLTPAADWGGWIFAGQILVARALLSGCITVRSSLWKHNYPAIQRGRITARLQLVRFSLGIATVTAVSVLFDVNPRIYVYAYPAAALIGAVGLLLLRPLRVRGEKVELAALRRAQLSSGSPSRRGLLYPFRAAAGVLRNDRDYRRYLNAMTLLGFGNIMIMPIMTIIITKQLLLSYYESCNLMEVLPRLLMMGSLLPWAALFDRVGVVRFRVLNAAAWTGASFFGGIAATVLHFNPDFLESVPAFAAAVSCIALARVCEGLGQGGGAIAWNIGHLHFAESDKAEIYMGTHVFLTGLRGLVAPFVGTFLYTNYGPLAFVVATLLALSGLVMFAVLARSQRQEAAYGEGLIRDNSTSEAMKPNAGHWSDLTIHSNTAAARSNSPLQ